MTTDKQIQANRKNALKSTGPRTELGKSFSSINATRHGLRSRQVVIEGESQAEFDDFRQMIIEHYAPADPIEASLVDRIAVCLWRLRRTETIEAQIFNNLREDLIDAQRKNNPNPLAITFPAESPPRKNDRLEICLMIKTNLEQYLKYKYCPEVAATLLENEASIKFFRENPNTYYIPGERRHLQFIREEFELSEEQAREIDKGIEYWLELEKQAEEENQPNLGHAVAADIISSNVLSKLTRYESQVQGNLLKAMHELDKLQKARKGGHNQFQNPIDVDINQ